MLSRYIGSDGKLTTFPKKQNRKILVLTEIIKKFETENMYTEKEINEVLKSIYDDYAIIRRSLVDYGFLDRNKDGSMYWVKS